MMQAAKREIRRMPGLLSLSSRWDPPHPQILRNPMLKNLNLQALTGVTGDFQVRCPPHHHHPHHTEAHAASYILQPIHECVW